MRAPEIFYLVPIHLFGASPSFRRSQDNHRPARTACLSAGPGFRLNFTDFNDTAFQCGSHLLVHRESIIALDDVWPVSISAKQRIQFFRRNAREDGWIGDLVAIQVKDRQHGTVAYWVEKLVRMPGSCQRPGLRFPVAHTYGDDQVRVVKCSAKAMRKAVAQLAAFMNRAGSLRRAVAANATGEGELAKKLPHARLVLAYFRINFRIRSFQIGIGQCGRRAMPGAGDVNHVQVQLLDQPVQMDPEKGLSGVRSPVPEQPLLDVSGRSGSLRRGLSYR